MVNKTKMKKVLKAMNPKVSKITQIGEEPLVLPNYSGAKRSLNEGPQEFNLTRQSKIQVVPTEASDIVNKLYVDGEITGKAWLQATAQTGLTGDKSGSFNLTTTGQIGIGSILATRDFSINTATGLAEIRGSGGSGGRLYLGNFAGIGGGMSWNFFTGDLLEFYAGGFSTATKRMTISGVTGNVGIGTNTANSKLDVNGAISSGTLTVTASADNTDVSGVNIMFVNITSNIVLGGLTGGVDGQVLHIVYKGNYTATCTVEDTEGVGNQDFYLHTRADEVIDGGGFTFICDGSNWYDCSHARHV